MHKTTLVSCILLLHGHLLAQAQDDGVMLQSCGSLNCPSDDSICSQHEKEDDVTKQTLVGIAENVVTIGGSNDDDTQISLTLVEEGRTLFANAPGLEAYERTLYVGAPERAPSNTPQTCALMLQYRGQTFPIPAGDLSRPSYVNGTTSCFGVFYDVCQDTVTEAIESYSSSDDTSVDCADLAGHIMAEINSVSDDSLATVCNYYSNLITISGWPLFSNETSGGEDEAFTDDECRPSLPSSNKLWPVGSMQTVVRAAGSGDDEAYGDDLFGGRQGFTPIITTVFNSDGDGNGLESTQFTCMQALEVSGALLDNPDGESAGAALTMTKDSSQVVLGGVMAVTALMAFWM